MFGLSSTTLVLTNGLLGLLAALLVFRIGWMLAGPRDAFRGAVASLFLFQLNPVAMVMPSKLELQGGIILVTLALLFFISLALGTEHWSTFMRAIVLALAWSVLLGVNVPTAVMILIAMVPWVFFSRRPVPALGIVVTMFLLGSAIFLGFWTLVCAGLRHWAVVGAPAEGGRLVWRFLAQGFWQSLHGAEAAFVHRLLTLNGWLSPFLFISGVWVTGKSVSAMLRDRRANIADLMALVAILILADLLLTRGKDVWLGPWHLLSLTGLWCPLLGRELVRQGSLHKTGFRLTAGVSFVLVALPLAFFGQNVGWAVSEPLGSPVLVAVLLAALAADGVSRFLNVSRSMTESERAHAVLTGSSLVYFLLLDCLFFR